VFASFFNNWVFLFVSVIIVIIQRQACTDVTFSLSWLFETEPISDKDFGTCVMWGFTVLIVSFLLKLTPAEWMEKVPIKINENQAMGADSKIVSFYQAQKNQSISFIGGKRNEENDDDYMPPEP
jgi:hypothetical protein